MQYLMPENMGFPIAGEKAKPYTRSGLAENMGLRTYRCAICKKEFEAGAEYRYKKVHAKKTCFYCSYTCFRVDDKKDREAYKRSMMGRWTQTREKTEREKRIYRVKQCEKNLKRWEDMRNGAEWNDMTMKRRKQVVNQIAYWRAQSVIADEELREMEEEWKKSL